MRRTKVLASISALALAFSLLPATPAFANATVVLVNDNAPGIGLNDPTPVAPVGGNPGTTLGQQRLNALQFAADIWGATVDTNVTVEILVSFVPLACNATSAVLASAGTVYIWTNVPPNGPYPGSEFPNTWSGQALASKRGGVDVNPVPICTNTGLPCSTHAECGGANLCTNADIRARFNLTLGAPGCFTGVPFYLGFDNNHGPNQVDVVTTALHEFGHGFGFQQFASVANGSQPANLSDVYGRRLLDTTINKTWNQMTNAERTASAINSRRVVWDNGQVGVEVPSVLALGVPNMRVNSPGSIAGNFSVGGATFGPPLNAVGVTGNLVLATDAVNAAGPSTTDGCTAITNAAAIAGNIALVDRGTCGFIVKAANVQAAGAIGMVVADNVAGSPPPDLGGVDPTIVIPAVRITLADGNLIKPLLGGGVNVTLLRDMTIRAGADGMNRAQLNAPNPVVQGSSISHWDPIAFPNQLMEPAINGDLTHNLTGNDLTLALMRDIGWYPDADVEGIADADDNCPDDANADQADNDADNLGDVCDPDDDNDNVEDADDNCPMTANGDQADNDADDLGDICDPDDDNDTVLDGADNCPFTPNTDQNNHDADAEGDACDADDDNDLVTDEADNCPFVANADQIDFDLDQIGDACDSATGPVQNAQQCMNGGWARFDTPRSFANQGLCVCTVAANDGGVKCPAQKGL